MDDFLSKFLDNGDGTIDLTKMLGKSSVKKIKGVIEINPDMVYLFTVPGATTDSLESLSRTMSQLFYGHRGGAIFMSTEEGFDVRAMSLNDLKSLKNALDEVIENNKKKKRPGTNARYRILMSE